MKNYIQELLKKTLARNSDDGLELDLARYSSLYGDVVYSEVMRLLTGKKLSACKSKRYWREALTLRDEIWNKIQYHLSIRAALLEVLQNKSNEFKNLVFMESRYLDSILHSSIRDGLTGLYNQTYLKSLLNQKMQLRRRIDDTTSALLLLDLDYFNLYNDCCGHIAGDEALRMVADIIREQIREQDVAVRYGGDEFAVYLPNVTKITAFAVADRIRRAVESTGFPCQEKLNGRRLTTSSGIAFFSEGTINVNTLIDLADRELYSAKRMRNDMQLSDYERIKRQVFATQTELNSVPVTGKPADIGLFFFMNKRFETDFSADT